MKILKKVCLTDVIYGLYILWGCNHGQAVFTWGQGRLVWVFTEKTPSRTGDSFDSDFLSTMSVASARGGGGEIRSTTRHGDMQKKLTL